MATSKHAKKRRPRPVDAGFEDRYEGEIVPSEPGPLTPVSDLVDDRDGPGFTPVKRGAANGVLVAMLILITVVALVAVFR